MISFSPLAEARAQPYPRTAPAASTGASSRGLKKVKEPLFVEDFGNGKKRLVWVYWKDHALPHGPPKKG